MLKIYKTILKINKVSTLKNLMNLKIIVKIYLYLKKKYNK